MKARVAVATTGATTGATKGASTGATTGAPETPAAGDPVQRARAFAEPLLIGQVMDTGEPAMAHADGTAAVLQQLGAAPTLCAAAYLVYAGDYLQRPEDVVRKAFGDGYASLVMLTRKLVQIQRAARAAQVGAGQRAEQTERVRKMLLAFSRDLRVVLLRLASRLQTLRWYATSRQPCPAELAAESMQVFAPLANRLGVWQVKWEMEDLCFRFLQPEQYQHIARMVDDTRAGREHSVQAARAELAALLQAHGLQADVQGRPKHLYSIWKKMQGKGLAFAQVYDARAVRVIVPDVPACYAALARVHEAWSPVPGEFDDYIARPKANGYQSLHTVVTRKTAPGSVGLDLRPLEVQIRTPAMHEHAENGVAAHWMYKEAGVRGTTGVQVNSDFEDRVAEARKAVLRELLAWERDFSGSSAAAEGPSTPTPSAEPAAAFDDRIYVFTPQATVIELSKGATPIDFAYALHTDLGHRCRGARVDGVQVPLNTPLQSGLTVEVVASKEGGPSLDWLNPELGYLASARSKSKVRAWFNTQAQAQTIAKGRDAVEKLLQREGRTALERQSLAEQLGFKDANTLFEVVGKDELSLRTIENLLRPAQPAPDEDHVHLSRPRAQAGGGKGGVLVVGMDSLLTTLARCCRPAPPDRISGYVTRGRGVAVHRTDCSNLVQMAQASPGRVIEVAWGQPGRATQPGQPGQRTPVYPLDVLVEADDRPGLLRDVSEVFAKDKMNVTGVNTLSKDGRLKTSKASDGRTAWMTFTVEATDTSRLAPVLAQINRVAGVRHARRR
jgi:GTP pyrophosphokinase